MTSKNSHQKPPFLGFGLGLRTEYYDEILEQKPELDWFEIISENYLIPGGKPLYYLDKIRHHYPLVMHGVSLSLGSSDPLDWDYLKQLKILAERIEPEWISDHLCWTGVNGLNMHDLLPLPYTEESITHIVSRLQQIQDYLHRPFLIENVSSYLSYQQSEMSEWAFINEIIRRAGCFLLLDVNNVYVSAINHDFNPMDYILAMDAKRVVQIHLAGHDNQGSYIIDTHDAPVIPEVWQLYAKTLEHLGPVSTMIERDDNMPSLAELMEEVAMAKSIFASTFQEELTS